MVGSSVVQFAARARLRRTGCLMEARRPERNQPQTQFEPGCADGFASLRFLRLSLVLRLLDESVNAVAHAAVYREVRGSGAPGSWLTWVPWPEGTSHLL